MSDREAFEAWWTLRSDGRDGPAFESIAWGAWQAALVAQQKEDFCSQCGQPFTAPACGFSHATIQEERRVGKLAAQQKAEPDIPLGTRLYPAAGEFKAQRNELTATPLDPEGIRLLREALDWVGLDSPMFEKIDAYLAKSPVDPAKRERAREVADQLLKAEPKIKALADAIGFCYGKDTYISEAAALLKEAYGL